MPIADDITLDAALYGSAHIETILKHDDATRIADILEKRVTETLHRIDLELAAYILSTIPDIVYSEEDLGGSDLPSDIIGTVEALRHLVRNYMGLKLVRSWDASIDERGRLIGLGEHSVRRSSKGLSDSDYKMAVLKQMGGGRRWRTCLPATST